jgi:hypothetical protein
MARQRGEETGAANRLSVIFVKCEILIGPDPHIGPVQAADDPCAHGLVDLHTLKPSLSAKRATTHARLASGRLACLYREGVEPSGSL